MPATTHDFKVGAILYASWGYDQTNVDFYEVTALAGKTMIVMRPIESECESSKPPQDMMIAKPGAFTGKPMRKRVHKRGWVKMASYSNAYPWDGTPKYETSFGWGH
jgi:hypothetical protein